MAGTHDKVALKEPLFAAGLAFLVPGLGHLYQRRFFKAALYFVCIGGTFLFGMKIGHAKVVYLNLERGKQTWPYACQVWAGLPALPALFQATLRSREALEPNSFRQPIAGQFTGVIEQMGNAHGTLVGQLEVGQPKAAHAIDDWQANLKGVYKTADGEFPVTGRFTDISIEPQVAPDSERRVLGTFEGQVQDNPAELRGRVEGYIPRGLWDRYGAPFQERRFLDSDVNDLDQAHFELGTHFELGVVYTMIAGLLNILAIYDALEGPAYEDEEEREPATPPVPSGSPDPLPN